MIKINRVVYISLLVASTITYKVSSAQEIFKMPEGIQTRWASPENPAAEKGKGGMMNYGRKGRPSVRVYAGDTLVLASEPPGTTGTIRRIWITIRDRDPEMLLGMKIEAFWDGADKPAISAPIGYFFGMGLGEMITFESVLFSSPEGRSFNSIVPMPFKNGMKFLLINETGRMQENVFYDIDYTVGDNHNDETLYFHAYYSRDDSTTMRQDYEFLPRVEGKGRFLGVNFGIIANMDEYLDAWWGEGEVKIYLDGDSEYPTLVGTGTEDYIGTAWGQGNYNNLYQGSHFTDPDKLRYCFYRYHIPDPIYFYSDIRMTIHQIGCCYGPMKDKFKNNDTKLYRNSNTTEPEDLDNYDGWLFERSGDDWASCVYFYLDKPQNNLPAIDPIEKRTKKFVH